jgi:hypothetical protein
MSENLKCDCCKREDETLFLIVVLSLGERWVCSECYLRMLPNPDRTAKF